MRECYADVVPLERAERMPTRRGLSDVVITSLPLLRRDSARILTLADTFAIAPVNALTPDRLLG